MCWFINNLASIAEKLTTNFSSSYPEMVTSSSAVQQQDPIDRQLLMVISEIAKLMERLDKTLIRFISI
jgi:hypothetical protein